MGRGRAHESYRRYNIGFSRGEGSGEGIRGRSGERGGERHRHPGVPHGGARAGGRHHRAHPALLPRTQAHPAPAPRGPHRLVRREPPGPPAHHRRTPGTRPHPQRHRRTLRGLRPRPRRRRTPRPRRTVRGDPRPPHPRGTGRLLRLPGHPGEPRSRDGPRLRRHRRRGDRPRRSRRLLDVSAALVREGVPLADVLSAAKRVRAHAEDLAELFTDLVLSHATEHDLQRLRPLAKSVVEAELSLALDRALARKPGE